MKTPKKKKEYMGKYVGLYETEKADKFKLRLNILDDDDDNAYGDTCLSEEVTIDRLLQIRTELNKAIKLVSPENA